ncbi:SAG1386/EF1546 family surface-associated protein [Weissella halotolerans]|uniref:LysM domain-containing protein n=1 Tax=Weissella halotolerans DSM 20190 TaxID=1123500 RepID=A0A0R2G7E3_9LACO|nr:SAG1386/EF1546 family surface-associated protein [Weissella halotolerans]KRN33383.1 hypothetical protein IV68_GL000181 [Weissella halotolerans DSM 20190]
MTDKEKQNEPWEASFKDEQPSQYSRSEHRRKSKRVSMTVGILVLLVVVLSFVPVYNYLQTLNRPENTETAWTTSSSESSDTKVTDRAKESSARAASKRAAKASSKKAASEAEAKRESEKEAAKASSETDQESSSSSSSQEDKQYATVEAGQGAYRVAANAGISQQELQTLNPGVNLTNIYAGQKLRVK